MSTRFYCRSCGTECFWCKTKNPGKSMPVESVKVAGGNIDVVEGLALVVENVDGSEKYVSHFVTCPGAGEHRRER